MPGIMQKESFLEGAQKESSLEAHERMYQNRLETVKLRGGKSQGYWVKWANDPHNFRKRRKAKEPV